MYSEPGNARNSMDEVLAIQAAQLRLGHFQDEFNTIRELHELPDGQRKRCVHSVHQWLDSLERDAGSPSGVAEQAKKSLRLRVEGNKIFTEKREGHRDLVTCIRLYTQAILVSPPGETLALAHANRAMALQEFGYHQQAYDDCECALRNNYPQRLRHKVLTRQAHCAWQLRNASLLEELLNELRDMPLNDNFRRETVQLSKCLAELLTASETALSRSAATRPLLQTKCQQIMEAPPPRGRHMIATQRFEKNALVFEERAASFVPVGVGQVCQQCSACLFVPFPCPLCHGRTVYCSRSCAQKHAATHAYECPAYQRQLFSHVGIAHLALRTLLDGLPEALTHLRHMPDCAAEELWAAFITDGHITSSNVLPYADTLRLSSHMGQMGPKNIMWFALVADLLALYLERYTGFFEFVAVQVGERNGQKQKWRLITTALILRHVGQMISNAHTCYSLLPARPPDSLGYALLAADLWSKPFRVRRGLLHQFSDYEAISSANFPYLSICNHSCEPSFQSRFNGRNISTIAVRAIGAGEEIFNCYTMDCRKTTRQQRHRDLKATYRFVCDCAKCTAPQPDAEFEVFHRYRCERPLCRQKFVPQATEFVWWNTDGGENGPLKCSHCGAEQRTEWFDTFHFLLKDVRSVVRRRQLYDCHTSLERWLLGYHELRVTMSFQMVIECFTNRADLDDPLDQFDYAQLTNALKYALVGTAARNQVNSIEYVSKMTFLWDFIAMGKHKCSSIEMHSMVAALQILSDEMRTVFTNYYDDFIQPLFEQ